MSPTLFSTRMSLGFSSSRRRYSLSAASYFALARSFSAVARTASRLSAITFPSRRQRYRSSGRGGTGVDGCSYDPSVGNDAVEGETMFGTRPDPGEDLPVLRHGVSL